MTTIRIELTSKEIASASFDLWSTKLYNRLLAAGIPVLPDGTLERGYLTRLDDPTDFGKVAYVWTDDSQRRNSE